MPGFDFWNSNTAPGNSGRFLDPLGLFAQQAYSPDPQSTQLANMSVQEWNQASNLLYPAATSLANMAENPSYVQNARDTALTDVNTQFANQASAQQRFMALQGINPTAPQQAALTQGNALSKSAAQAGAQNQAAGMAEQTQQQILGGL